MAQEYKDKGLVVLAINSFNDPKDKVAKFAAENKFKHRILLQGKDVAKELGVKGIPTVFWIDKDGRIVDMARGFSGQEGLKRRTQKLMGTES